MGSNMSTAAISKSIVVDEVNASPETLWSVLTDVENMPQFLSAVEDVKVLPFNSPVVVDDVSGNELDQDVKVLSSNSPVDEERQNVLDHSPDTATCRLKAVNSSASTKSTNDSVDTYSCHPLEFKEGFSWEETRSTLGKQARMIKYVTSIELKTTVTNPSDDDTANLRNNRSIRHYQKHFRLNIAVLGKIQKEANIHESKTCTCTLIVGWDEVVDHGGECINKNSTHNDSIMTSSNHPSQPTTTTTFVLPKKCQFTLTMAFIPKSRLVRYKLRFARCCGIYLIVHHIMNRLIQSECNDLVLEAERREKLVTSNPG
jgi:Polyketide cyclase / dehydrase and lipid transport